MTTMPVKELPADLVKLIHNLNAGESVTFVGESGKPEAVLVGIDTEQSARQPNLQPVRDDWFADWDKWRVQLPKIGRSTKVPLMFYPRCDDEGCDRCKRLGVVC